MIIPPYKRLNVCSSRLTFVVPLASVQGCPSQLLHPVSCHSDFVPQVFGCLSLNVSVYASYTNPFVHSPYKHTFHSITNKTAMPQVNIDLNVNPSVSFQIVPVPQIQPSQFLLY